MYVNVCGGIIEERPSYVFMNIDVDIDAAGGLTERGHPNHERPIFMCPGSRIGQHSGLHRAANAGGVDVFPRVS